MLTRRHFLATSAACAAAPLATLASTALNLVATTGMIADCAGRIGGDLVNVTGLFGPGIDPHSYRQTRSDIVALTRADLVLWHGLYLEAQMEEFLLKLGKRQDVVAVTEGLDQERLISSEDYEGRFDPHVWMDPALWQEVTARITSALISAKPEIAAVAQENLETLNSEIAALGKYGESALAQIPQENRVLITAHDAFAYFGRAFGLEVIGVQGISTDSEAGLHRMSSLVDMIVERGITSIFVESSVSDQNMRALIEGAAAQGHKLHLGGELFSDAMGPIGTYEGTFVGMFDHNITTIARALGADVPRVGLNGRLSVGS